MSLASLFRRQLRSPLFFLTVFALVTAVVAVNATTFSAIHTLRWKALPYAADDSLVWLKLKLARIDNESNLSEEWRAALARDTTTFRGVAGFVGSNRTRSDSAGGSWRIAEATPQLDDVLGIQPALGRGIRDEDAHAGSDRVLVISDALWRRRFGADPGIIGRAVRFGERTDTIVGVMPQGFAFPDTQTDAWRPFVRPTPAPAVDGVGEMDVVARLQDGATRAQALASLERVFDGGRSLGPFAALFARMDPKPHVEPWRTHFIATSGNALALLQVAALILLLAIAANLVNMQLDRLLGRSREFGTRRALGASEWAINQQALLDVLLPTLAGAATGLVLAIPGLRLLAMRHLLPESMPVEAGFDSAMVASAVFITTIAFATALVAVRMTRGRGASSLRGGAAGIGTLRPALLLGQIVVTTALLGSAGLLLRSALNVLAVDPGFDASGVLMTGIDISTPARRQPGYDPRHDGALQGSRDDLLARVAALPGVGHVATADLSPFSGGDAFATIRVPGEEEPQQVRQRRVSPGYFATLGIPLVEGRCFGDADGRAGQASPVIVDQRYVQMYLQGRDPLASSIATPASSPEGRETVSSIVGVVRTVRSHALDQADAMPMVYRAAEAPDPVFILLTRTGGDATALVEPMRRLIQQRLPDALIAFNQPLAQRVASSFASRRALVEAMGGFAALTLALAALGLAAVLGFAIRRRSGELAVRLALGATPARIRRLVLRQGGALVGAGLALGLLAGLALARLLADRLFGVSFSDPANWCATLLLVAAIALFACWLPARRAAATNPVEALRND